MKAHRVWLFLLVFWGIDVALAAIVSLFAEERVSVFFLTLAILWVGGILLGVWSFINRWIAFALLTRKALKANYIKVFRSQNFPDPRGEYEIEDYLRAVVNSEASGAALKHSAYILSAEIEVEKASIMTKGLMLIIAGNDALREFDQTYRPSIA